MVMEVSLLERRREINRRAARKSRSRQKEVAIHIRKKYYEAQSANTKLVYERNQLEKERNQLREFLETHPCTLGIQPGPSAHDQPPFEGGGGGRGGLPWRPSLVRSHSAIQEETALVLGRSVSCPTSRPTRKLNDDHGADRMGVSSDDDSSRSSISDSSSSEEVVVSTSFTELGLEDEIFASNSDPTYFNLSELPQNLEDSSYSTQCDDLSSILNCRSDGFEIFDELIDYTNPTIDLLMGGSESNTSPMDPVAAGSHSHHTEAETQSPLPVSERYVEAGQQQQQSEALDLSSKRVPLPRTQHFPNENIKSKKSTAVITVNKNFIQSRMPSNVKAKTVASADELVITEQSKKMQEFAGNIPLHVENFIVGEKY